MSQLAVFRILNLPAREFLRARQRSVRARQSMGAGGTCMFGAGWSGRFSYIGERFFNTIR